MGGISGRSLRGTLRQSDLLAVAMPPGPAWPGILTEAWSPGRPGAVLILDVPDEAEAGRLVAQFPLVQAALISTELVPLHPIEL